MKAIIILFFVVVVILFYIFYKYEKMQKFAEKYLIDEKDDAVTIFIKFGLSAMTIAGSIAFLAYKFI